MSSTAVGVVHRRRGEGGEDAHGTVVKPPWAVAAVADGHGSSRYPRADRGARLAVECALRRLADLPADDCSVLVGAVARVPAELISDWRQAVVDDLVAEPLADDEVEAAGLDPDATDLAATLRINVYGSTVIAAAVCERWLTVVQVGDGDAVAGRTGLGRAIRPVPPSAGTDPRYTDSLCQLDAVDRSRISVRSLVDDPIDVVLLATDGFGAAFADPDWHDETVAQLLTARRDLDDDTLSEAVSTWCAAPAEVGGDDVSIALLVARDEIGPKEAH